MAIPFQLFHDIVIDIIIFMLHTLHGHLFRVFMVE